MIATGVVARRLLVTVRVDPAWLVPRLPVGFEPVVVDGAAVGGFCMLRWEHLAPGTAPAPVGGLTVDGIAERWFVRRVERPQEHGVVIPRRLVAGHLAATAARLVTGGVVARGQVREFVRTDGRRLLRGGAHDGGRVVEVAVAPADGHRVSSLAGGDRATLDALHRDAVTGWSVGPRGGVRAAALSLDPWSARPVTVEALTSPWLPAHATVDHGLLMTGRVGRYRHLSCRPRVPAAAPPGDGPGPTRASGPDRGAAAPLATAGAPSTRRAS